ncbi:transient receptor potential cation channel subfamily A member 1 homolog [Ptychodera flava]|uniref:transient receptor potential cation channel subfamily A member 1 homolog n=1 Tax=Ptychodera flava TaxID=63121 RepID=UPI00396AA9A7
MGQIEAVDLLLDKGCIIDPLDKTRNTPLHLASAAGHSKVVETLLKRGADNKKCDNRGRNCLDLAIENNHKETALAIITHEKWRNAMNNGNPDTFQTPMRQLIKKMPGIATEVLNRCMTENMKDRTDEGYSITFDFSFIDDTFSDFKKYEGNKSGSVTSLVDNTQEEEKLTADTKPYTNNASLLKKNHPLTLMVKYEQTSLLGHPVVKSLIRYKWKTYSRHVYYTGMIIYFIFVLFLTGYLLSTPPPYYFREDNATNGTLVWYANGQDKYGQEAENYIRPYITKFCKWFVVFLGIVGVVNEVFQACIRRGDYISFENIMEWFIYLSSLLLVFDFSPEQHITGLRNPWQWCLGAFAVFFAWMGMIIYIRKVQYVGTFVVMFTDMLKTFGHFCIVLFLFLLAFSLSFYSLLMNQSTFSSYGYALMKTFVMLTGEFEYSNIFHGIGYLEQCEYDKESPEYFEKMVWYEGVTYVIFAIFIVIAAILIMNLLIGLALHDVKAVQEKAELKKHALQIEFALDVEQMLPLEMRRKYHSKTATISPNAQKSFEKLFKDFIRMESGISAQAIARSLNPEKNILERKLEQLEENQTRLLSDIQNQLKKMQEKETKKGHDDALEKIQRDLQLLIKRITVLEEGNGTDTLPNALVTDQKIHTDTSMAQSLDASSTQQAFATLEKKSEA